MKRIAFGVGIAIAAMAALSYSVPASAEALSGVKMTLIQATGSDAKFERVDVTNLNANPVDVTGWKLVYKTASGSSATSLLQLQADPNWHVMLGAGGRESFVSKELVLASAPDSPLRHALQFTGGMNHPGGGLQVVDANGQVVDAVGWGTASDTVRLGEAAPAMTSSTWLVRRSVTGNNMIDFALEAQNGTSVPSVGLLYEVQDICTNLAGLQVAVPDGMERHAGDVCLPIDVCVNLDGVQSVLPDGMEIDVNGDCQVIDLCHNLDGIQAAIPDGYEITNPDVCEPQLPVRKLLITELLPNPSGSDAGNEFIELLNADTESVLLDNYQIAIGDKLYRLPAGVILAPGSYFTVSDSDLAGSQPNTTGLPVYLVTIRGLEILQVPAYVNAGDDQAWALVDDRWQFTYAPTPGAPNVALAEVPCLVGYERDATTGRCRKLVVDVSVTPCRENQYRSEETGRCRSIVPTNALTPCRDGQYRSEETNRCRSIASLAVSTLRPCADDQFRNPLTNRCKSIASSDDVALADCGEGRERNPETNRCRNMLAAVVPPSAAFAVEQVRDGTKAFVGWWALGGVGLLALAYAGWEWRREVSVLLSRVRSSLHSK